MKVTEFRKLIREEIQKVLKEEKKVQQAPRPLERAVYYGLSDDTKTYDDFIILDMIPGQVGFDKMIKALNKLKVVSCTVKPGSIDSGYKGYNVVVNLESGNQIKLFIDKDEFSGTNLLKVVKSMTTKPDGKLLASAIQAAME
jgi:hypothetical protein